MTTRRLVLRRFLKSDGEGLYDYLSDPEVVKYEPYEPYTREMAEQEAARRAEDQNFWAVCLLDGALLGNVYFAEGEFDTWELGYVFNRKYWGKGMQARRPGLCWIWASRNGECTGLRQCAILRTNGPGGCWNG